VNPDILDDRYGMTSLSKMAKKQKQQQPQHKCGIKLIVMQKYTK